VAVVTFAECFRPSLNKEHVILRDHIRAILKRKKIRYPAVIVSENGEGSHQKAAHDDNWLCGHVVVLCSVCESKNVYRVTITKKFILFIGVIHTML